MSLFTQLANWFRPQPQDSALSLPIPEGSLPEPPRRRYGWPC